MANIVIPDFTLQAKPRLEDVQEAERSIVEVLGGRYEGVANAGNLELTNLVAAPGFVAEQVRETRSRVALATSRWYDLSRSYLSVFADSCYVLLPVDVDADVVTFVHYDPTAVVGTIAVYLDGVLLTEFVVGEAVAQGVGFEFQFRYSFKAGSVLRFKWRDAATLLKHEDNSAILLEAWVTAQVWGVARHRA